MSPEKTPTQLLLDVRAEKSVDFPAPLQKSKLAEEMQRKREAEKRREYRKAHHRQLRESEIRCKKKHRAEILAKQKTPEHRAKAAENMRRWRQRHPHKVAAARLSWLDYQRARRKHDPMFCFKDALRGRIRRSLTIKGIKKHQKTFDLIGCTAVEARAHIEKQFVNGMSWSNRASFHLDHFVPIDAFDLSDPEERKWAFNYRNLRPLTPIENMRKHTALPNPLPSWLPAHITDRILARVQQRRPKISLEPPSPHP